MGKTIAKTALVAILVFYLLYSGILDLSRVALVFQAGFVPYALMIFALLMFAHILLAVRLKLLMENSGSPITIEDSLAVVLVGVFFNNFVPGGNGGDLVKIYYLKKFTGQSYFRLGATILIDRLTGLAGLGLIAFAGLLWMFGLTSSKVAALLVVSIVPTAVIASVLILRYEWMQSFFLKVINRVLPLKTADQFLVTLHMLASRRRLLVFAILLSSVANLVVMTGVFFVAYYIFDYQTAVTGFVLFPVVLIASAVPVTPGNIGWSESVAEIVMTFMNTSGGATIFASWRIITIIFSLVGGFIYLRIKSENETSEVVTHPENENEPDRD